ncbi:GtrA family protein [Variovorax sp. HJSM1_2]|uniref:GtrA family protein n=1 Tax=Variovorax sp. HJSM1_2 TaxID=3366263 RepID=UPI003BBCFC06
MAEGLVTIPRRGLVGQLLSYALVGLLSNMAGYFVYLIITHFGVGPKVTMTVLYFLGAYIGFWGNRRITFKHEDRGMAVGFRYMLAHSVGYLMNFMLLYVLVDRLGYPHQLAQAFSIVVVAVFLFVSFRYFVFPSSTLSVKGQP